MCWHSHAHSEEELQKAVAEHDDQLQNGSSKDITEGKLILYDLE